MDSSTTLLQDTAHPAVDQQVIEILAQDDEAIALVLKKIQMARPDLFSKVLTQIRRRTLGSRTSMLAQSRSGLMSPKGSMKSEDRSIMFDQAADSDGGDDAAPPTNGSVNPDLPIVQFSSAMAFGEEGEPCAHLKVMRIGDLSARSVVHFATADVSAVAGKVYKETSAVLEFAPGEGSKRVEIPLIDDDQWDTTTEFRVKLLADGLVNATLGRFLWQCRVKILDDETFPTSTFHEQLLTGEAEDIPPWVLFREYCMLNFQDSVTRANSIRAFVVGQVHNLFFCLKVLATIYLMDFVLVKDPETPAEEMSCHISLLIITAVIISDVAVTHFLDYQCATRWPIAGRARKKVQAALVRKFLNFDEHARENFPEADLVMALVRDIPLLVGGYTDMLRLTRAFSMLLLILLLQFLKPMLSGHPPSPVAAMLTLIFPAVLIPIIVLRNKTSVQYVKNQTESQNSLIDFVNYTVDIIRIIIDYSKRSVYVTHFEAFTDSYNGASKITSSVLLNNGYFATWVIAILTAVYTFMGSLMVLEGKLTIGLFVANLSILTKIGSCWSDIYKNILDIQAVFPSMTRIVHYINLTTDLKMRMALAKQRDGFEEREIQDIFAVDQLPIRFRCTYTAGATGSFANPRDVTGWNGDITIAQGALVAFVGTRGGGKSTLLRMLGGAILPWDAENILCYVPAHLRVLHVSVEPLFIKGTLRDNLLFGVTEGDTDGGHERVVKICKRLGMTEEMLSMMDQEQKWDTRLSHVEAKEVMLARALIANYHVLCIHRPTMGFSDKASENVMELLREFVVLKGVEQDPDKVESRRPRTCIITSSKMVGIQGADEVFQVDAHTIVKWDKARASHVVLE